MNQKFNSIEQCEDQFFLDEQVDTLRDSKSRVAKSDSFKIFADEKWENLTTEICSRHQVDYLSRFDEIRLQEKTSIDLGLCKYSSNIHSDDSLDSKDSCLRQDSNADSEFFHLDQAADSDSENYEAHLPTDDNLLNNIPQVESFIIPKNPDSFYLKFMQDSEEQTEHIDCVSKCSVKRKRVKRWLKNQDRRMFKIILNDILRNHDKTSHQESVINGSLLSDIHNSETMVSWLSIKNKLGTHRSIEFLQERYKKLLANQKLNSKEMSLLSDKYDQIPLNDFLVIFPGKSVVTLNNLIQKFQIRDSKTVEESIDLKSASHYVQLEKMSSVCASFTSDKVLDFQMNSVSEFNTIEYLNSLDKRTLKRLSYSIKQMMGKVHLKYEEAKRRVQSSSNE